MVKEIGKIIYFAIPFLNYLPRSATRKNMAKLNNLYDEIIENKLKSMKTGELDEKINNNSADLLDYMIYASNDPENPTFTNEELRVRIIICKKRIFFLLILIFFLNLQYNLIMFMLAGHETSEDNFIFIYLFIIYKYKICPTIN